MMPRVAAVHIVASAVGLIVLCVTVTVGTAFVSGDSDYMANAISTNLVAIVFAFTAWTGIFWERSKNNIGRPVSWVEWLGVFAGGLIVTLAFLLIDCGGRLPIFHPKFVCDGHPGFSVIFTVGAIGLTVIAVPSAIRAWILEKFGDTS